MDSRQKSLILCASIAAVGTASFAIYQLTRILFSVVRDAEFEATKLLATVTAQIESDSPDVEIPEELVLEDDIDEVYSYGSLQGVQELYYRRDFGGDTDWLWSFDKDEWYGTGELSPDHTLILDPPSIIFISRLHLISVARRKALAADARAAGSSKQAARIPPPVEFPEWAQEQLQQQLKPQQLKPQQSDSQQLHPASSSEHEHSNGLTGCSEHSSSSSNGNDNSSNSSNSNRMVSGQATSCSDRCSSSSDGGGGRVRRLEDAPELLCCPITGQLMMQPVSLPSGKTFEYEAIRKWITQHGTDPTTGLHPVSLLDLHPNLIVREMVEKWLNGVDPLGDHVMDSPAEIGVVSEPTTSIGSPETELLSK